jgi:glycosyltransferase involved in cell wall biosynthesis
MTQTLEYKPNASDQDKKPGLAEAQFCYDGPFPKTAGRIWRVNYVLGNKGPRRTAWHFVELILRKVLKHRRLAPLIGRVPPRYKAKLGDVFRKAQQPRMDRALKAAIAAAVDGDFIVICNSFPGDGKTYGGEFVCSRAKAYARQGLTGAIFEISRNIRTDQADELADSGMPIFRLRALRLNFVLRRLAKGRARVLVHSPPPHLQEALQSRIAKQRLVYWYHGAEIRDYRRLYFNFSTAEMAALKPHLDTLNQWRMKAGRTCFQDRQITKVFVSTYLKAIAERDVGMKALCAPVIPNFIDGERFAFQQKSERQARRFLLIRSFAKRNYANDIAIRAIKILSSRPGFEELHFTIRGFGEEFAPLTRKLAGLSNIVIEERYSTPDEMAALHWDHGVFLCPSRFDTQGVTMGEAMASGLVCITNEVAGIPEFIDETTGILVPGDDPKAYAEAIWRIKEDPAMVPALSKAAGERVREQCGFERTIAREVSLIQGG